MTFVCEFSIIFGRRSAVRNHSSFQICSGESYSEKILFYNVKLSIRSRLALSGACELQISILVSKKSGLTISRV